MNPVVRLLLLIVTAVAIGGFGVHEYQTRRTEDAAKLDLLRVQRDFDERAPAAREIASPADYADEVRGLFKWYFGAVRDHDNHFPDQRGHDRGWKDIVHKHEVNAIKPPEFEEFSKNHAMVEEVYKLLESGRFDPIYSAASTGQHFDIWRAERDQHEGKPMIRFDFVWWGPQRKIDMDKSDSGTTRRVEVAAVISGISFSLLDDKGKVWGEMNGGEPNAKVPDPDRYMDLFPSNAVIGTYWIDLFPHEAQKLNLTVNATTRTVQGHELGGKFDWSIPLKDDWKLAEGQKWEGATEEVRDDDENAKAEATPRKGRKGK